MKTKSKNMNPKNDSTKIEQEQLLAIVKKFGSPLYVYNSSIIARQFNQLNDALTIKRKKIYYACKALTNVNILKLLKSLGAGLDTVSIEEVKLGLHAGFNPQDIIYTPNCVAMEELDKAMQLGVKVNIDNLSSLAYIGNTYENPSICLRFNPQIMAGGNENISVGHIDSKFGIPITYLEQVKVIVEKYSINVNGIHIHTGSDIQDLNVFMKEADLLFELAEHFPDVDYLDFGGGFKVKYKSDDMELDVSAFGLAISQRFNDFCEKREKDIQFCCEPGKYLVSESGQFLVQTTVIKQTPNTLFVGVNSGFNHLVRPILYDAYHKVENLSNPDGEVQRYTVVGYICEKDTFAKNRKINHIRVEDILCFSNAGAYCFSMASNYNLRCKPAEVLVHNDEAYLIREREKIEDILDAQKEVSGLFQTKAIV